MKCLSVGNANEEKTSATENVVYNIKANISGLQLNEYVKNGNELDKVVEPGCVN